MNKNEVEVKFLVKDLSSIQDTLIASGASLNHERVLETNWRFDTPDRSLTSAHQVLRLRKDTRSRLTFKASQVIGAPVSIRREIEFEVSDLDATCDLLEALGYEVSIIYEKYRTTYQLDNLEIVLDEMPFGTFVEIEGQSAEEIEHAAIQLHLNWEHRCTESYLALFDRLKSNCMLDVHDLTFANFEGIVVSSQDLHLSYADFA